MRRNTESRYRIKLIQEMHLNKAEQKYVDDYKQCIGVSYKNLYCDTVDKAKFSVALAIKRLGTIIARCGSAFSQAIRNFVKFSSYVRPKP